jgi:hypothetical protein
MSDRVRIDWRVPAEEWSRFRSWVVDEYGSVEGYLGREAEAAMQEFADTDGYAKVEERVDRLVEAAGYTSGGSRKQKTRELEDDRTRVTARVESGVKDEFREVARDDDDPYGVVFARAISAYMDGGRPARLERKLERVLDDAAALLSESSNESSEETLSKVERRTISICNRLGEEFHDDELTEAISDVAGESEPTLRKYRERVAERKGVEPHPNVPDKLWVTHETAESFYPDTPEVCRRPPSHLSRSEKRERLQLELGEVAANRSQKAASVSVNEARRTYFNQCVSESTVRSLMDSVSQSAGWSLYEKNNSQYLGVDLSEVAADDAALYQRMLEYAGVDAPAKGDAGGGEDADADVARSEMAMLTEDAEYGERVAVDGGAVDD